MKSEVRSQKSEAGRKQHLEYCILYAMAGINNRFISYCIDEKTSVFRRPSDFSKRDAFGTAKTIYPLKW